MTTSAKRTRTKKPWRGDELAGDRFRGEVAANYLADRVHKPTWSREQAAMEQLLQSRPTVSNLLNPDLPLSDCHNQGRLPSGSMGIRQLTES